MRKCLEFKVEVAGREAENVCVAGSLNFSSQAETTDLFFQGNDVGFVFQKDNSVGNEQDEIDKKDRLVVEKLIRMVLHKSEEK